MLTQRQLSQNEPMRKAPLLLLTALLAVGCAPPPQPKGGIPKRPAEKIVSLSPGVTEIIAHAEGSQYLVGRTAACNFPKYALTAPIVCSVKPDYEKIAAINPRLVVYDASLFREAELKRLEDSDTKILALGGNTVDEFIDSLFNLAKQYGGESAISEHVDKIESARRTSAADPATPTPKVAILIPGGGYEHMIAGVGSFQADLVRAATGMPVGPDGHLFVTLNAEAFVKMNPDVIVTAGDSAAVLKDPRLQSISAIKNKRVVAVLSDVILRRGWRSYLVIDQLHSQFSKRAS